MKNPENNPKKLFSYFGIDLATFLGGPAAAAVVLWENLNTLGQKSLGKIILVGGMILQFSLFGFLISLPEPTLDQFPKFLIPFLSSILAHFVAYFLMNEELQDQKAKKSVVKSNWRAAGIGLLTGVLTFLIFFLFLFLGDLLSTTTSVDDFFEKFEQNEAEALELYDRLETDNDAVLSEFVRVVYQPKWEENLQLIQSAKRNNSDYPEFLEELRVLELYVRKRMEIGEILLEGISSGEDYFPALEQAHVQMDSLMKANGRE